MDKTTNEYIPCPQNNIEESNRRNITQKNKKKVAFKVIDSGSFLTYIWRGIYKHKTNNILSRI